MSVLYIKEQGAMLVKRDERVQVTKGRKVLLEMPAANIENITVIGNVQISAQALVMLMEKGIDISYFSFGGKYIGRTAAEQSKNIFLRFAQHECYRNLEERMEMARQIVRNKVRNQIELIRRYRFTDGYDWKPDVNKMRELIGILEEKKTPNEILGVEGMCSHIYFGVYSKMFQTKNIFQGRNRRPPKDPVNVVLSLGYTFLTKDICAALESESFEMYLGFLHGIRYGRKSLALDVVEEFRQPVIDRMVRSSFNKGMISENDFDMVQDRILLSEEGFGKFCRIYEKWMKDKYYSGERYSFQELVRRQAKKLKKSIQEKKKYEPYQWKEADGEDYPDGEKKADVCDQL